MHKTYSKFTSWWRGVIKSLYFIYSRFVFGQVSKNTYIQFSYLVRSYGGRGSLKVCIVYIRYSYLGWFLRTNIFDIHIRSGTQEEIYLIFVFGQVVRNKYIRYSYSDSCLDMNIFDIRIFIRSRILYSSSVRL